MINASAEKSNVTTVNKPSESETKRPAGGLRHFEDFEDMFENFFSRGWLSPFGSRRSSWQNLAGPFEGRAPQVDIVDRENDILVKAELPGVDKEDVDVTLTENTITIKGACKAEEKDEKGDYYRCEISQGSFSRTLALPSDIDTANVKATFSQGVLRVAIPKLNTSTPKNVKIE